MTQAYTTLEQSKQLVSLGLDPMTADMYHCPGIDVAMATPYITIIEDKLLIPIYKGAVPCWSLAALLALIPTPTLQRIDDNQLWYCKSIQFGNDYFTYDGGYHDSPIEACIETIKWLLENNHIKKGEQK